MRIVLEIFWFGFQICKIKGYYWWKYKFCSLPVSNPVSRLLQIGHKLKKWKWRHNFLTLGHCQFFDSVLFLLSSLVTGPSLMSISSLVLELWQFSFIKDWAEIQKSEIPQSEFCQISGDWDKLGILNSARMSLIKCYWMLFSYKEKEEKTW